MGPKEENFIGPTMLEFSFKVQPERTQSGMRIRGLHAGPDAPQAYQTEAASSPSAQRVGSSAKAIALLCPGDERAGVEAIFGEKGRAIVKGPVSFQPQPTIRHYRGLYVKRPVGVGPKFKRNEALWYGSLVSKERKRSEKGKSPRGSDERLYAGRRDDSFKEDVVHPLPSKR